MNYVNCKNKNIKGLMSLGNFFFSRKFPRTERKNEKIGFIFCGPDKGNLEYKKKKTQEYKIQNLNSSFLYNYKKAIEEFSLIKKKWKNI